MTNTNCQTSFDFQYIFYPITSIQKDNQLNHCNYFQAHSGICLSCIQLRHLLAIEILTFCGFLFLR